MPENRIGEWANMNLYPETTPFHPLFAYEAILSLIGFGVIMWGGRRFAPPGCTTATSC